MSGNVTFDTEEERVLANDIKRASEDYLEKLDAMRGSMYEMGDVWEDGSYETFMNTFGEAHEKLESFKNDINLQYKDVTKQADDGDETVAKIGKIVG